jgi:hypothetical protein
VPFVCIQVVMIGITIAFPQMVMHYKGPVIDPSSIEITVPGFTPLAPAAGTAPTGGATLGAPNLGAPNLGAPTLGAPNLGAPNLETAPAEGTAPALPQPNLGAPTLGAPVVNP